MKADQHISLCDLFTCAASSVCSIVNKMLALKGENNCKYKQGELHPEQEQTCISDSLTVTWGVKQIPKSLSNQPHIVLLCLT